MTSVPQELIDAARSMLDGRRRLLGITGPPGSGKSTVAAAIAAAIGPQVIVAPMDGFHRLDEELNELGLLSLKGVPDSFDGDTFVEKLRQLVHEPTLRWPDFDRAAGCPMPDAITIEPHHELVIVEGNYLLLDTEPWNQVSPLLDTTWYLDVPEATLLPRLTERHARGGKGIKGATAKVASTDLPNARLVERTKHRADRIVDP